MDKYLSQPNKEDELQKLLVLAYQERPEYKELMDLFNNSTTELESYYSQFYSVTLSTSNSTIINGDNNA